MVTERDPYCISISCVDKVPNLLIIDIDGQKKLTFAEEDDAVIWPSFSPISDTIAYTFNQGDKEIGARILTMKSDGTEILEFMVPFVSREQFAHPGRFPDDKIIYLFLVPSLLIQNMKSRLL